MPIHDPLPTPQSKVAVFYFFTCVEKAPTKHEKDPTTVWLTLHPIATTPKASVRLYRIYKCVINIFTLMNAVLHDILVHVVSLLYH